MILVRDQDFGWMSKLIQWMTLEGSLRWNEEMTEGLILRNTGVRRRLHWRSETVRVENGYSVARIGVDVHLSRV